MQEVPPTKRHLTDVPSSPILNSIHDEADSRNDAKIVLDALMDIARGEVAKTPMEMCDGNLAVARQLVIGLMEFPISVHAEAAGDELVDITIGDQTVTANESMLGPLDPDGFVEVPVNELKNHIAERLQGVR